MLKTLTTHIGTATLLEHNLIEVTIHTGVELDRSKLFEGYEKLSEMAGGAFAILVNRTATDYSLTFDAMEAIASHPGVLAQALLIPPYNPHKHMIAEMLVNFPRHSKVPVEYFTNRKLALDWLRAHRESHYANIAQG